MRMRSTVFFGPSVHPVAALAGGLLAILLLPSTLPAQQVPAAVATLYEEVRIAIEMEDIESIRSRCTSLARVRTSLGQGVLPALSRIFNDQENLAAELRFDDAAVVGDKAFAMVTWAISGRTSDTGDPWSATMERTDMLLRQDGTWRFLASDEIDRDALSKVTNGIFEDTRNGLAVEAPANWRVIPVGGAKSFVTAISPDLNVWLIWVVADLPGTFGAEQLARAQQDALEKLGPNLGLQFRDTVMEPTTLAGRPAFSVKRTTIAEDGIEVRQAFAYCVIGSTLYMSGYSAVPPGAYETLKQEVERSLAATRITGPEIGELPPEAGRVEGRKYVNDTYGCEIMAPEGWEVKIGEGEWKIQVSMQPPRGESFITLGMIDLPDPTLTAEQAILADDSVTSQAFENYEVIRQGETTAGNLPAHESVTRFDFGETARQRWRIYLVDADRLFFMFADVTPPEDWGRLEQLVDETFQSLRIFEAQPPADAPEPGAQVDG